MDSDSLYIIDTSSLIALFDWRPPSKHHEVWKKLDILIDARRLISPYAVYEELRAGKDAVARWAARRKKAGGLFKKTTAQHARIAKQIVAKFHDFVEYDRPAPQADPFVVALAVHESKNTLGRKSVVITEEKYTHTGRPRIPHVCEKYGLSYLTIHQTYVSEGWTF
jgi:hypothetical protein